MTRKRVIRKRCKTGWTPESSKRANAARWAEDRRQRDAKAPAIIQELAEIRAQNLPYHPGDVLGNLQWTEAGTGKVRRWVVRVGDRRDRITLEFPGKDQTRSMGWSHALVLLRKHLSRS